MSKSPFVVFETEFVNNQKDADCTLLYQMLKFRLIFEQNTAIRSIWKGVLVISGSSNKKFSDKLVRFNH